MNTIHTFGQGVPRGRVTSISIDTTGDSVDLVKKDTILWAGVEALTIKTDKDIIVSLDEEEIETSTDSGELVQGAVVPAGTTTINWDSPKIKMQAVSETATVEILAVYYDNILKG